MKPNKSATNLIEKFKFDQKETDKKLERDPKGRLFWLNSTFSFKIDFFDNLIDFKVIHFDFLIKMWSIIIQFNWKRDQKWLILIKNRLKLYRNHDLGLESVVGIGFVS